MSWPYYGRLSELTCALLTYSPLIILISRNVIMRRIPCRTEVFIYATGLWVLIQTAILVLARGDALEGRYLELYPYGVAASLAALCLLHSSVRISTSWKKNTFKAATVVWSGIVMVGLIGMAVDAVSSVSASSKYHISMLKSQASLTAYLNDDGRAQNEGRDTQVQNLPFPPHVFRETLKVLDDPAFREIFTLGQDKESGSWSHLLSLLRGLTGKLCWLIFGAGILLLFRERLRSQA